MLSGVVVIFGTVLALAAASNVQYVNPLVGTGGAVESGSYGGMIPSTATPFAMTRWTPMTRESQLGVCPYIYSQTTFYGFLGTHQPALWMVRFLLIILSVLK